MLHSAPRSLEQIIPEVVQQTLKDAQLTTPLPDCGIVVGSSRAQQGKLETFASQVSQGGPARSRGQLVERPPLYPRHPGRH